ncbi:hypothetical protein GKZ68_16620 [Hymenobacter sp. BRD128]|uniref:hypothetical protein n=1 Tax=Hymenobacter sp. BRD128 TaxID=2675878 RepID=UPI001563342C|nr:hypothetical protein [Hymenobacter sp. BRD128]QKG58103.1 hypothetical protein GKZ68_16620 [Hymenobacter sp. BRD128]
MKFLATLFFRGALPLFLLGLLSGCAVYDSIFHPHRLPTPKMDATTKAKVKAAEKARHKGLSLKAADDANTNATGTGASGGDPAAPSVPAAGADEKKKTMSYSDLPEGTRIKYDKQGLVKKSFLDRRANNGRKLHHYDTRPLTPREASRENRKIRKKGHTDNHGGGAAPSDKTPVDRAPDTSPDPTTAPLAPAESVPPPKPAKATPKPDPTQPAPVPAPKPEKTRNKASKAPVPKPDPTQPAPR